MGLLATLKSWLGLGSDTDNKADAETAETPTEEPKLDPNGATETRVKTTDTAVDALKQTRSEAAEVDADAADGDATDAADSAADDSTAVKSDE